MGYCHECGTKQESSDLFCFSCGYKLPQDQNKNNLVDSEIESCVTSTKGLEIRDIMVEESKDFVNESAKTHFNPSNESSYKRFTVNEFAQEIRMLYPGGYNDLSDSNLVDLWLKKYPEDTNKIIYDSIKPSSEKKSFKHWYWIGFFLILIGAIISYGMYKESLYPKTESELTELLCDKFWKISEVEVQEIYYDGKLIPKPTSNVVENLKRSFDSDSKEFVYKTLKEKIEINKNYDSYTSFSKNYNYLCGVNTYWCYNQSYDESLSDYKYSISCYTFDHQNGKYSYKSNNLSDSYYSVRNNEFIETTDIISDQSKVDEISSENLIEISDVTLMVDGVKCRVVCKITYEKCIPNNTLRYDEEKSAQAPEVPVE